MHNNVNPAVGIDLGTTNTVVAVQIDPMGPMILEIPQPVSERSIVEPILNIKSAVYFEDNSNVVVGEFANPKISAFRSMKSNMGTRWKVKHPFRKQFITASYINAHILKLAHQTIIKKFPSWDSSALITVPASFNTDQRNDTIVAADLAGFKNVKLLDEPTAAFYYFFNQHRDSNEFNDLKNILVFDFGGGTLDVSVISIKDDKHQMILDAIGRSRYNNIGGDDIDLELATFLLGCWEYKQGQEVTELSKSQKEYLYRLFITKSSLFKEEAEDYIINDLELPEFVIIEEDPDSQVGNFRRTMSLSQYEAVTGKFLQNKSDLNIYRPIEEALSVANNIDSNFSRKSLDLVLYTGGSTKILGVQRALESYFSGKICLSIDEEDACNTVALGAAACRYDELFKEKNILMTNRILENVFTRTPSSKLYTTILPLETIPTKNFLKVDKTFRTDRPLINLKFPLFRGVSKQDHQLAPMRDLEIPLDQIIEESTPYSLHYRLTENKTIELKVIFETRQGPIDGKAKVKIFDDMVKTKNDTPLCKVNAI
jgi:molecular chaperone DnaK